MKKTISTLFLLLSLAVNAQKYEYKIQVKDVTNLADAKMITDYLRDIFKTYPSFNDSTDCFEFKSELNINKQGFEYYMKDENKIVLIFERKNLQVIKEEEK